jgi:hypothetical protein
MNNLHRWIAAYEQMDERRRQENLPIMEATALAHPERKRRKLHLVANNSRLNDATHSLSVSHDSQSTVIVSGAE